MSDHFSWSTPWPCWCPGSYSPNDGETIFLVFILRLTKHILDFQSPLVRRSYQDIEWVGKHPYLLRIQFQILWRSGNRCCNTVTYLIMVGSTASVNVLTISSHLTQSLTPIFKRSKVLLSWIKKLSDSAEGNFMLFPMWIHQGIISTHVPILQRVRTVG